MLDRRHVVLGALPLLCGLTHAARAAAVTSPTLIVNQGGSSLSIIDGCRREVVQTLVLASSPARIAVSTRAGVAFVTHPDAHRVSAIELAGDRAPAVWPVQGQPFGIAVAADGRSILIGVWNRAMIARLDAATGAITGEVAVGRSPADLVIDRARGRLYVANREDDSVSMVDLAGLERRADVAVGRAPFALALSPNGDRLYVANVQSNDLSVIDTRTAAVVATVPVGRMPYGVTVNPDETLVLVVNQHAGTLSIIDAERLRVLHTVEVGDYPEGISIAANGSTVYVANWFSDDVSVIHLSLGRETHRIPVGAGPRAIVCA